MGFGSNVNKGKQPAYDLNAEHVDDDQFGSDCPVCLEPMVNKDDDDRTIVKLQCDHTFHLDCIGSAFNAKNKMQCPNCRNVEQGRWLYATSLPLTNFSVEDRIAEFRHQFSTDLVFGMEVCPFRAFGHRNPFVQPNLLGPNIFFHEPGRDGGELCPYIEYNSTFPISSVVVGDTSSRDAPNPSLSNPSHLIPISLLPTNPRIFQNVSNLEVIRARHYFSHPFIDHSSIGYGTSMANVPLIPPNQSRSLVGDAPIVLPYLGGNSVTSALVDNAQLAWPYLVDNLRANALLANPTVARPYPVVPPLMGGLPTPVWPSLMFPFGWGQRGRGVTDFWSTPSGLNHMVYGGGGINNMASGSGSSGRGSSGVGESSIDISGGSGRRGERREDGSNGGGESSNSRSDEHMSQGPT